MSDTTTNKILVNVVLDRSGSMASSREGTVSGYNEYLNGLRSDKDKEYSVTLIQFDAPMTDPELTITYQDKALTEVSDLTLDQYQPRGNTPLYDAIGECVRRVDAKGRGVITLIITDGAENASREFTKDTVKALIQEKEKEGWQFVFLGANIDSMAVGGSLGVNLANCANYAVGNEQAVFTSAMNSSMRYASAVKSFGTRSRQAVAASALSASERSAMMGGPNAGANFPFNNSIWPQPKSALPTNPVARKSTNWTVKSDA